MLNNVFKEILFPHHTFWQGIHWQEIIYMFSCQFQYACICNENYQ